MLDAWRNLDGTYTLKPRTDIPSRDDWYVATGYVGITREKILEVGGPTDRRVQPLDRARICAPGLPGEPDLHRDHRRLSLDVQRLPRSRPRSKVAEDREMDAPPQTPGGSDPPQTVTASVRVYCPTCRKRSPTSTLWEVPIVEICGEGEEGQRTYGAHGPDLRRAEIEGSSVLSTGTLFDREKPMQRRTLLAVGSGLLLAVTLFGCGGEPAFQVPVPDRLTLYSIDGRQSGHDDKPGPDSGKTIYGYPILGKVVIDDPKRRETLIRAFNRGIERSDGTMAKCFWPRHALRLERDGKVTDYLICFQCLQFAVYPAGQGGGAIDRSPQPTFDEELKRAGIPLAPTGPKGTGDE